MSAEETIDILEESMGVMDQTMDVVEKTMGQAPKASKFGYFAVGVLAFGAGAAAMYVVAKKHIEPKYRAIAQEEVLAAKEYYSAMNKKDDYDTPEKAVEKLQKNDPADIVVEDAAEAFKKYHQGGNDVDEEGSQSINVFRQSSADSEFDYAEELKHRTPDHPYIISEEEYMNNETSYDQSQLTYYEGDGTLADSRDKEIPLIDNVAGEDNLTQFGHGSGDVNIVFIRNERLELDFEVLRSEGKYAHEVLGFEHSDGGNRGRQQSKQAKKFRGGDE
ncbi:MAG: hypothetical protein LC687_06440 [Actinobacteria bacterium]|nr:hypothetical protein [Actinomycetota bacterium]MCA1807466.1 hypothetical protein [Actinomycetota bacterium]